jgi:hypothetical protein
LFRTHYFILFFNYFPLLAAESWTIDDVLDWLKFMKLEQYVQIFSDNQIDGSILLDLTLEDLDYLEVTILGHRKTLLRGINDLKQSAASSSSSNKKSSSQQQNDKVIASSLQRSQSANRMMENESGLLSKSVEVKKTHWSQLEPISANAVSTSLAHYVYPD